MLPGGSRIVLTWIDAGVGELPAEVDMLPRIWYACLHASICWVSVRAVGCCCVPVSVRSLLEFENIVSIALLVAPTTYPPITQQSVVFFLVWFSNLQRLRVVCLGIINHNQIPGIWFQIRVLFCSSCIVSRRNRSRLLAAAGCSPVVRPLGCSGCCIRWRVDVFVPVFEAAISGHHVEIWFRWSGGKGWSRGGNT